MPRTPATKPRNVIKAGNVRAVERAVAILEAFSAKPAMSVLEIQKAVGLSRPTLYRILETLASKGFIRSHGTPQRFSLDYAVGKLAQSWSSGLDVITAARPMLERLHEETEETVGLMILRGQHSICVVELASPHVLAISRGIGPMGPLGRGASGKAILAHADDATREAVLKSLPKGFDTKRVRDDLAAIRRDGFRISRGEVIPGATSVAAPFFDHTHAIAGAIAVYAPDARADNDRVAWMTRPVVAAAAELSAALGHKSSGKPASESVRTARAR
jgi:IclR family acetate operon transcriptional repressor